MDIKTRQSIENTNPDYYKDELYLDEDFRMLAKTYPADISAIGVTTLIDYVEAVEAELARRDEIIKRLKEDADRLAIQTNIAGIYMCIYCHTGMKKHTPDCPITLHRALMKELEEK